MPLVEYDDASYQVTIIKTEIPITVDEGPHVFDPNPKQRYLFRATWHEVASGQSGIPGEGASAEEAFEDARRQISRFRNPAGE
jgi:hypothetical protein